MGTYSFKLPDLGEGIVESEISEWHVKVGDVVEEDQHIADVMTDKAVVEVSAPVSGKVVSLACEAGEVLAVGVELIRFEIEGEGTADEPVVEQSPTSEVKTPAAESKAAETKTTETKSAETKSMETIVPAAKVSAPEPLAAVKHDQVLASPSVRQRARDENIDLSIVPGSGPAGRISNTDLDNFIAAGGMLAQKFGPSSQPKTKTEQIKIKGLRRVIAQKMEQSKRNIPHYSYVEELDVTQLEELRQLLNAERDPSQPKLTLLPFIMKALVKVLPKFPHCNATYNDQESLLTQHEGVHIGIATMTEGGLMVPVVKHAEAMDIWQMAASMGDVTTAAKSGKAKSDQLSGSTITITSLGAIGGIVTTPVINAPEVAIIGVNKLIERPVVQNGQIVIRKMMNLSSSFDHRIVDGYDGAQLIQAIKKYLENPAALFV